MSQFPQHRVSNSDDVRSGNAASANRAKLGVPFNGAEAQALIAISLGSPILQDADGVSASQTVTGAGTAFLINGALAASGAVTFDVPRNVVAAWTNTAILTITGTDVYGQTMVETTASGTSHTGKKAFKTITSVTTNATVTGATVGTGIKLGLPYRPVVGGFLRGRAGEDTADSGTYVAPGRSTATGTSADVRGTYSAAATLDGATQITVMIAVQNGPNDSDAFGVAQFAG
jgi:hypothetical protein